MLSFVFSIPSNFIFCFSIFIVFQGRIHLHWELCNQQQTYHFLHHIEAKPKSCIYAILETSCSSRHAKKSQKVKMGIKRKEGKRRNNGEQNSNN